MADVDVVVVRHMDFSLSPEPVTFTIAPDEFRCVPEIPLDGITDLVKIARKQEGESDEARFNRIYEFFDSIMEPESATRFRRRGRRSTPDDVNTNPIGMRHVMQILPWLMEVYGLRPTQASAESSDGSTQTSTPSTDGASPEESTT